MDFSTVILDRDGVINYDSDAYIKSPAEWQPIPGSLEAIARLKHAGLRVVVATNQSGIGRNLYSYEDLTAIHAKLAQCLADLGVALDGLFFCPHTPAANCRCRKPHPGMLEDILARWQLKPWECVMVGDSGTDIEAAQAVGIRAFGVRTGNPITDENSAWQGVRIFADLSAVVGYLLDGSLKEEIKA